MFQQNFVRPTTPMMLGHLFAGQVLVYLSFIALVLVAESRMVPRLVLGISSYPFLRISDAKGTFYLLFSFSTAVVGFMLETARSVAKIYKSERMKYRIIKAQRSFTYMSSILFVNFLGTYIFKSLNDRVMNLLMFGLFSHMCCSLSAFLGLDMLNTFFYFNFAMANISVLLLTYFIGFDVMFAGLGCYIRRFRLLGWF